jgi:hypothetical protein
VTLINQNLIRTGTIQPYKCGDAGVTCSGSTDANAGFSYSSVLQGYDFIKYANAAGVTLSNLYGQPTGWQNPRVLRFQVRVTF